LTALNWGTGSYSIEPVLSRSPVSYDAEASLHTLSDMTLALQEQASNLSDTALGGEVLELVTRSGPVAKAVLLILVIFSVVSWGIVLIKFWQFRRATRHTASFLDVFRRSSKFSEVQAVCQSLQESPLVGIFQSGYAELRAQLKQAEHLHEGEESAEPNASTLKSLDALDRALLRATSIETSRLERQVPFLATTASVTPFIGLFGTVWGIMNAFQGIGQMGSTSLDVVAPGIAEALIATAAGLLSAIPAVYFYNHFTYQVRMFVSEMENFSLDFLNIAERNFT